MLEGLSPSYNFTPRFIDGAFLQLLNQNHDRAPHIDGLALAYAHPQVLRVPDRSIRSQLLRPILQACRGAATAGNRIPVPRPGGNPRHAPHTLIYTGMRWHLRKYCEKHRDFVLSRFRGSPDLSARAAHDRLPTRDGARLWTYA